MRGFPVCEKLTKSLFSLTFRLPISESGEWVLTIELPEEQMLVVGDPERTFGLVSLIWR